MLLQLWQRYQREIALIVGIVLLVIGQLVSRQLGIEWNPAAVRGVVDGLGPWGPVIFVGLLTFRQVILIPSQVLLVAGGLCFGVAAGTLYGALGLLLSGTILFLLTRYVGRESLMSRIPDTLKPTLESAGKRAGPALMAVGTGYPVGPLSAYHAAAGLTGMSLAAFVIAVGAGALVRGLVFTYFGAAITEGQGFQFLVAGVLLMVAAFLPLGSRRARAWILGQNSGGDGPGDSLQG